MLDEIRPIEPTIGDIHLAARSRLTDRHLTLMDKLMIENQDKKKYWILGTAKSKRKNGRTSIKPFLKAFDVMPQIQKESYLYEIDNIAGTRTLLWVMHPNNKLAMPSINKTISVAG